MTSSSYAKNETWTPLPLSTRKWEWHPTEQTYPPSGTHPSINRSDNAGNGDDFSAEASYTGTDTRRERPDAPRLSHDHIWGVRDDWGERAKSWGQGAKVYSSKVRP